MSLTLCCCFCCATCLLQACGRGSISGFNEGRGISAETNGCGIAHLSTRAGLAGGCGGVGGASGGGSGGRGSGSGIGGASSGSSGGSSYSGSGGSSGGGAGNCGGGGGGGNDIHKDLVKSDQRDLLDKVMTSFNVDPVDPEYISRENQRWYIKGARDMHIIQFRNGEKSYDRLESLDTLYENNLDSRRSYKVTKPWAQPGTLHLVLVDVIPRVGPVWVSALSCNCVLGEFGVNVMGVVTASPYVSYRPSSILWACLNHLTRNVGCMIQAVSPSLKKSLRKRNKSSQSVPCELVSSSMAEAVLTTCHAGKPGYTRLGCAKKLSLDVVKTTAAHYRHFGEDDPHFERRISKLNLVDPGTGKLMNGMFYKGDGDNDVTDCYCGGEILTIYNGIWRTVQAYNEGPRNGYTFNVMNMDNWVEGQEGLHVTHVIDAGDPRTSGFLRYANVIYQSNLPANCEWIQLHGDIYGVVKEGCQINKDDELLFADYGEHTEAIIQDPSGFWFVDSNTGLRVQV